MSNFDFLRAALPALHADAAFKARTVNGINQKLNLIRKAGNAAVHDDRPVRNDVAQAAAPG